MFHSVLVFVVFLSLYLKQQDEKAGEKNSVKLYFE